MPLVDLQHTILDALLSHAKISEQKLTVFISADFKTPTNTIQLRTQVLTAILKKQGVTVFTDDFKDPMPAEILDQIKQSDYVLVLGARGYVSAAEKDPAKKAILQHISTKEPNKIIPLWDGAFEQCFPPQLSGRIEEKKKQNGLFNQFTPLLEILNLPNALFADLDQDILTQDQAYILFILHMTNDRRHFNRAALENALHVLQKNSKKNYFLIVEIHYLFAIQAIEQDRWQAAEEELTKAEATIRAPREAFFGKDQQDQAQETRVSQTLTLVRSNIYPDASIQLIEGLARLESLKPTERSANPWPFISDTINFFTRCTIFYNLDTKKSGKILPAIVVCELLNGALAACPESLFSSLQITLTIIDHLITEAKTAHDLTEASKKLNQIISVLQGAKGKISASFTVEFYYQLARHHLQEDSLKRTKATSYLEKALGLCTASLPTLNEQINKLTIGKFKKRQQLESEASKFHKTLINVLEALALIKIEDGELEAAQTLRNRALEEQKEPCITISALRMTLTGIFLFEQLKDIFLNALEKTPDTDTLLQHLLDGLKQLSRLPKTDQQKKNLVRAVSALRAKHAPNPSNWRMHVEALQTLAHFFHDPQESAGSGLIQIRSKRHEESLLLNVRDSNQLLTEAIGIIQRFLPRDDINASDSALAKKVYCARMNSETNDMSMKVADCNEVISIERRTQPINWQALYAHYNNFYNFFMAQRNRSQALQLTLATRELIRENRLAQPLDEQEKTLAEIDKKITILEAALALAAPGGSARPNMGGGPS